MSTHNISALLVAQYETGYVVQCTTMDVRTIYADGHCSVPRARFCIDFFCDRSDQYRRTMDRYYDLRSEVTIRKKWRKRGPAPRRCASAEESF